MIRTAYNQGYRDALTNFRVDARKLAASSLAGVSASAPGTLSNPAQEAVQQPSATPTPATLASAPVANPNTRRTL